MLRSLDFARFRPRLICAETSETAAGRIDGAIVQLMQSHTYSIRGGSFVNSICVDNKLLARG